MRLTNRVRYALVGPVLVLLLCLFVGPMIYIVASSFQSNSLSGEPATATLQNYVEAVSDSQFTQGLWTSLWISLVVTLVGIVIGFPLAILYSRSHGLPRFALTLVLFLPLLTSSAITSYGWLILLGRSGAVNTALQWSGIIDKPVSFLYHPLGLIIAHEQWVLPFIVLPIAASLSDIDPKLYRASASLGAGWFRQFRKITVPLSIAGIVGGAAISYALTMSSYVTPAVIGGGRIQVLSIIIYDQFVTLFNAPLGSAIAMVLFLAVLIPVTLFVRGGIMGRRS